MKATLQAPPIGNIASTRGSPVACHKTARNFPRLLVEKILVESPRANTGNLKFLQDLEGKANQTYRSDLLPTYQVEE